MFSMQGVARRMRVAFTGIVLLLFFAGATSLLELERVSHDTEKLLMASEQNVGIASDMLSALSDQNDAIIYMAVVGDSSSRYRLECENSMSLLSTASQRAYDIMASSEYRSIADSLNKYTCELNALAREFLDGGVQRRIDESLLDTLPQTFTARSWYVDEYKVGFIQLSKQVSQYMTSSQNTLSPEVNRLSHTARRSVTPVFISLLVMFVVVLMLYFFLKKLYVKPILRINRNLGDYLAYKVPFDKSVSCRDEIEQLRDRIDTLISKSNK
jgi:methyl-accepting chemotaxis protein